MDLEGETGLAEGFFHDLVGEPPLLGTGGPDDRGDDLLSRITALVMVEPMSMPAK